MNDITSQDILVKLNTQDIDSILNKFDINTIEAMELFTNLMVAYIYSRRHKEDVFDYSARSVDKMKRTYE